MLLALLSALTLAAAPPVFIYKWRDAKGNLHVTDRFDGVPPELREKFEKLRAEAEKRPAKSGAATVEPVRETAAAKKPPPPQTAEAGPTAYQRLMAKAALEKKIKKEADDARAKIQKARAEQATLAEEKGNLQSNPVLNAAQPGRVERMNEIDTEIKVLDGEAQKALSSIARLVEDAQERGYPEEWVTGY
jgi:hypothetical protein